MNNEIYLVTGAAGFLGSNICSQLLEVYVPDKLPFAMSSLDTLPFLFKQNIFVFKNKQKAIPLSEYSKGFITFSLVPKKNSVPLEKWQIGFDLPSAC